MSAFVAIASMLVAVALLILLLPLLRARPSEARPDRDAVNAQLYREQLADLERDRTAGTLPPEQFAAAHLELERRLLEDVGGTVAEQPPPEHAPRWTPYAIGAGVPAIAVAFYLWVGNPDALDPQVRAEPAAAHSVTPEEVTVMVERLAERLKQSPNDPEGWAMLARSFNLLGRFDDAVKAYERLAKFAPDDPTVLADYADALAMARGRKIAGEPQALIQRALKADPNHVKALALAGSAENELGNHRAAADYWRRILPLVGADSELGRSVQASIDEVVALDGKQAVKPAGKPPADKPSAGAATSLSGTVQLAPALAARVAKGDTLFVFARAHEGPRMPLAIVRATVADLPYAFRLDDSQAMTPGVQISGQSRVVVGARISKSGNAMPQPGDLFGVSAPVAPGATGIALVIDQEQK